MSETNTLVEDDSTESAGLGNLPPPANAEPAPKQSKQSKQAKPPAAAAAPVQAAPKRVRIILEENDNIPPTGLFVGINGRSFLIRPGEEVDVPSEVLEVLNDAVEATPKTDLQGNVVDYRNKMRFPYRIVAR